MKLSTAKLIASWSGPLALLALGLGTPSYAVELCQTSQQVCFIMTSRAVGSACQCTNTDGTSIAGVIVDFPGSPSQTGQTPTYEENEPHVLPLPGESGNYGSSYGNYGSTYGHYGPTYGGGSGGNWAHSQPPTSNTTGTGAGLVPTPTRPSAAPVPSNGSNPLRTNQVRTTRSFFGPHDIPPENFAAYGIVAFPQKATSATVHRQQSICEAFLATLPPVSASPLPTTQQMVTVWPVDSPSLAERLNKDPETVCKEAVEHYDLSTALIALKEAQTKENYSLAGEGPYLLAWAPSSQKGKAGSIVLIADLSGATTAQQYLDYFQKWRDNIEENPQLWPRGWSESDLLTVVRNWADKWGTMILSVGHAKDDD